MIKLILSFQILDILVKTILKYSSVVIVKTLIEYLCYHYGFNNLKRGMMKLILSGGGDSENFIELDKKFLSLLCSYRC